MTYKLKSLQMTCFLSSKTRMAVPGIIETNDGPKKHSIPLDNEIDHELKQQHKSSINSSLLAPYGEEGQMPKGNWYAFDDRRCRLILCLALLTSHSLPQLIKNGDNMKLNDCSSTSKTYCAFSIAADSFILFGMVIIFLLLWNKFGVIKSRKHNSIRTFNYFGALVLFFGGFFKFIAVMYQIITNLQNEYCRESYMGYHLIVILLAINTSIDIIWDVCNEMHKRILGKTFVLCLCSMLVVSQLRYTNEMTIDCDITLTDSICKCAVIGHSTSFNYAYESGWWLMGLGSGISFIAYLAIRFGVKTQQEINIINVWMGLFLITGSMLTLCYSEFMMQYNVTIIFIVESGIIAIELQTAQKNQL